MTSDEIFDFIPKKLLKDQNVDELVEDAYDFAHTNGIVFRLNDRKHTSDIVQSLPITLFPTPFPNKLYKQAISVQDAMVELYFKIAWDHDFIVAAHQEVVETDDFTCRLLEIYEKVWQIGSFQKLSLSIQRADYMAHVSDSGEELKQIEVNHIAAGMGGMAQRLSKWHQRILKKVGVEKVAEKSPVNKPLDTVAEGLLEAWKAFDDEYAAILVVVEDVNQNQLDQKSVDYRLEEIGPSNLRIIRASLTKCAKKLAMRKNDLFFLKTKIGVIYFRSGYSETQYPTENEWNARLLMELSSAIKCPWIGLQLANTKKIQQLLALPGIVEQYFPNQLKTVKKIRETFAGLWGLDSDDPLTERKIIEATKNPEKFVLKPQKEGGGGNFYEKQICEKFLSSTETELAGFILMEKLNPLVFENLILRAGQKPKVEKIVSELSIFGYALGNNEKIFKLHSGGHFLRSKNEKSNECGLSVGAGALDTVFLY